MFGKSVYNLLGIVVFSDCFNQLKSNSLRDFKELQLRIYGRRDFHKHCQICLGLLCNEYKN